MVVKFSKQFQIQDNRTWKLLLWLWSSLPKLKREIQGRYSNDDKNEMVRQIKALPTSGMVWRAKFVLWTARFRGTFANSYGFWPLSHVQPWRRFIGKVDVIWCRLRYSQIFDFSWKSTEYLKSFGRPIVFAWIAQIGAVHHQRRSWRWMSLKPDKTFALTTFLPLALQTDQTFQNNPDWFLASSTTRIKSWNQKFTLLMKACEASAPSSKSEHIQSGSHESPSEYFQGAIVISMTRENCSSSRSTRRKIACMSAELMQCWEFAAVRVTILFVSLFNVRFVIETEILLAFFYRR